MDAKGIVDLLLGPLGLLVGLILGVWAFYAGKIVPGSLMTYERGRGDRLEGLLLKSVGITEDSLQIGDQMLQVVQAPKGRP